jgi:hypothetical protein
MENINIQKTDHDCVLHIHWSQLSAADQRQAHPFVGGGKSKTPRQLKCLTSAFDFDVNHPELRSKSGVHIWFHNCSRHALAMHLKRTGELIPLLKQHLAAISIGSTTISNKLDEEHRKSSHILDLLSSNKIMNNQETDVIRIELF